VSPQHATMVHTAKVWGGPAQTVLGSLALWSRVTPDAPVVVTHGEIRGRSAVRVWTYREVSLMAAAAAACLQEHLRVDEAIVLQAPNGPEFVSWFLGGLIAGVRVCAMHPSSTAHEIGRVAERAESHLVIGPRQCPSLLHLPLAPPPGRPTDPLWHAECPSGGSVILQSSGTSGAPRLARRTELSLDADARGLAGAATLSPADRVLMTVPMSHSYGVDLLVATILAGASMQVFGSFDLASVQQVLRDGGATVFPGVPFMFEALGRTESERPSASLRLAFSAGSSLPPRVSCEFEAAWGFPIGQLYGATELGTVTLGHPAHPEFDARSVGLPVLGASVRVASPGNRDSLLPVGTLDEGELAVMAPSMLAEYVDGDPPLIDGHFPTGDLGRVDSSGRVHITGRLTHLIDVGGLKVNPVEVEQAMCEHPGIAECALVPIQLSDTVVRLRLLFVARGSAAPLPDDLRSFARERLSPHKLPRIIEQVGSLPRTPAGKLLRHLVGHQ